VEPTVRLLDNTLVDQIAAGEVIERPANIVKELLENAIDAGATAITVAVEDGGRGQVRVTDDGAGMSAEDAALCIERHATSKIRSFEDLVQVGTLGFRGEALPSIGSVSKMTIVTRPEAELEGTRVVVEGGAVRAVEPAGCPPGTSVEVIELFYNVPARKKFLRARQTETSRVFEICQRVALSNPELRLVVTSDGRTARQYLPAKDLAERAYQVFGEVALHEIHAQRGDLTLDAALAPPELARAGARHLFLLVNGRPITDRALARAIAFAYGDRLRPGHYPRGVVSLRMPPEDVDVNAHPQKTEVRFRQSARLLDQVTRMLAPHLPSATAGDAYWSARIGGAGPAQTERTAAAPDPRPSVAETGRTYESPSANGLRYIAQVRHRLVLCESEDELLIVDRERADGARRLDALTDAAREGKLARQNLLFPDRLELGSSQAQALSAHTELLESLGFEWSQLGDNNYVVRAVPALVADVRATALFEAALDWLCSRDKDAPDALEGTLAVLANASARPNGEPLSEHETRRIVAAFWPSRPTHRPCIVTRIPLPSLSTDETDV